MPKEPRLRPSQIVAQSTSGTRKRNTVTGHFSRSRHAPSSHSTSVSPAGASAVPSQAPKAQPILFYERGAPFYAFTNFSPHDVIHEGKRYPTSEHLFQAFKFLDDHPELAERIRTCGERPSLAFDEAHKHQKLVRSDWRQVNVQKMEITLRLKFTQHPDLETLLLGTGDADLLEDSPRDYFWGIGADGSGKNELGKALMKLRGELRRGHDLSSPASHSSVTQPITLPSSHDAPFSTSNEISILRDEVQALREEVAHLRSVIETLPMHVTHPSRDS